MVEIQDIPLTVQLSSSQEMHGVVIRYINVSHNPIDVGMPHPENPYAVTLSDSTNQLIVAAWGVFAPPKPLWIATLNPLSETDVLLPLSRIYWLYTDDVPYDVRKTPHIDGRYTVTFDIPWLDSRGKEHMLTASACVAIQLTNRLDVEDTVSRFPSWSIEDILNRRSN